MARDRYLWNDKGEETIHENEIKADTPKSKWENFWFYHKIHVVVAVVVCILVGSFIHEMVSKVNPDYEIAFVTTQSLPMSFGENLGKELAKYGEDLNGDGQVNIQVNEYVLEGSDSSQAVDANQQMASVTRFSVDVSDGSSVIFVTDEDSFSNNQWLEDGFFVSLDGDAKKTRIAWSDVKAFASYQADISGSGWTEEGLKKVESGLGVSIRKIEGTAMAQKQSKVEYYAKCQKLFENMRNGTPVQK